jgi:hypothetical protein
MARTAKESTKMSTAHKEALAQGRAESLAVRNYLEALTSNKPKRGRKRTTASIDARLKAISAKLDSADALTKLSLIQERKDLEAEKAAMGDSSDLSSFEKDFVAVAASYSTRKGIDYASWRAIGVDAKVLKAAGVKRTRSV